MNTNDDLMTLPEVGEVIRNTMKAKGLTQSDIEKSTGVGQSSVSKICLGKRGPGIEAYNKVCGFLGIVVTIRIPTISADQGEKENIE